MNADVRRALVGVGLLVAALAVAAGVWWWSANRPAHLVVTPTPADAVVRAAGHEAVGELDVEVPAGAVTVEVRAPGHLPSSTTLRLQAGDELHLQPELIPLGGGR